MKNLTLSLDISTSKLQAVAKVSENFDLNVKDDEADAILIGSYFVNYGQEFGNLENHNVS